MRRSKRIVAVMIGMAAVMAMTSTCWAAGYVKQEMWQTVDTVTLDDAILIALGGTEPTTIEMFPLFEFEGGALDAYVERMSAWVIAPVSGDYTFYISGDDDCGLWIVDDANDLSIVDTTTTPPLCRVTGWAGYLRDYEGAAERKSAPVALEAGVAYKLVTIRREGSGGDYTSVAWTLPGSTTIDTITGEFITDETKAGGTVPADTETNVMSGVLSWLPPAKSSGSGLTYDVYFGTDANLPAPYLKASDLAATTYDAGAVDGSALLFGKTYYWRIDVTDPNEGGTPSFATGDTWSFTTNDGKPYIITAPENVFGTLNGDASFTVVANTLAPTPLNYQWAFKTFFGTTWTDIDGATLPTYTKNGLQPSDRGLYRVTITDLFNNSITAEARLYMRIGLVNRYSFTDNADDSVSGAHGTIYQTTGYPATFIDAPGTSGDPMKRQLYLTNGPTRTGSNVVPPLLAYVDLPNGLVSTLGTQVTFMAWFTWRDTDTGQQWQRVFDFGNSTGGENASNTGNNYIMLTPRSDGRTPRFGYKIRDGGEERYLNSSASLGANVEVCYAVTWNEDTGRTEMYLNGKIVSGGNIHFSLANMNDINNWLGRAQWPDNGFWGNLNEFRIYDVALPANSIAQSYELGADVLPSNPCVNQPTSDINQDCVVDLNDFALIAQQWLECGLTTCP